MFSAYKSSAVNRCYEGNYSLTPQRLIVLEAMYKQKKPISAYDLRKKIWQMGGHLNIATIYRILDFWCSLNLMHRISVLNKFICCVDPDEKHVHIINFCEKCKNLIETCNENMGLDLKGGMQLMGLSLSKTGHIEIPVICSDCLQ